MASRVLSNQKRHDSPAWRQAMTVRLDYNAMMAATVGKPSGLAVQDLNGLAGKLAAAHRQIVERTGPGADFLGFLDLPYQDDTALDRIVATADRLAKLGDRHVVLGIGGSYLGARAVLDALGDPLHNERGRLARNGRPRLYFEGNNLDPDSMRALMDFLPAGRPAEAEAGFTVNVISKSGTTLETAVAFRILRQRLAQAYGDRYSERIVATTDARRGLLKEQADREGFETFVIPDDVGGRFSVLTPVGLLPAAIAGIDIKELVAGARSMAERCKSTDFLSNPAYLYAALQHLSEERGRNIWVMVAWGKALEGLAMWYDQLSAESLGKAGRGRIPLASVNTRDLHSRGQELQQGPRSVVVTNLCVDRYAPDHPMLWDAGDPDGLNYAAGKTMGQMLAGARQAVTFAYSRDQRPSMTLHLPELNAYTLGQVFYLFELATLVEGYMAGINPLDQPGVEDYKKFMFGLLGRTDMAQWKREFEKAPTTDPAFVL